VKICAFCQWLHFVLNEISHFPFPLRSKAALLVKSFLNSLNMILKFIFILYFWLDPKVPKDQGWIKISGFLRNGLFTRYKPLQRTGLRLLLYRLLKACATIHSLKTGEIFIRPQSQNARLSVLFPPCHSTVGMPYREAGDLKRQVIRARSRLLFLTQCTPVISTERTEQS